MKTINNKLDIRSSYPLQKPFTWEEVIFFDIETTGFSAKTSYLYLIGCMYFRDNTWQITQWLADDMNSEALIIEKFSQILKSYKRLVHFNGSGFDIPFILQKCKYHHLENPFQGIESFDIYKKILPYKKLLPLMNYKLKTIEAFAGFKREDTFSGEDLIQIYANYLGRLQYEKLHRKITDKQNPIQNNTLTDVPTVREKDTSTAPSSEELSRILLLHNLEDVKGLLRVADILYYTEIFELEPCSPDSDESEITINHLNTEGKADSASGQSRRFDFTLPFTLPQPVRLFTPLPEITSDCNNNCNNREQPGNAFSLQLSLNGNQFTLIIPVYQGELKYFYDNFRDYYYLPKEDTAIHKSVAQYVDKEFKIKAKLSTCYTKKSGCFLPQPDTMFIPFFKVAVPDKITYFETNNPGHKVPVKLNAYIKSILHYILSSKETKIIT